ncbi:MerR family transcriptional regulator [Actinophytocola xanthii]|uniref:MerR family transcriptional regulator n=1 Tax=Actinophytocola xanthii TaxID=1912961 RepID=A0A1Q8C6F2_9PSEU|nr:MerR family transcriptional regulator [Actinophytocola xanthii]OLF09917.1 MerR family transcriptional regulator [Actinophytocola xanthii]
MQYSISEVARHFGIAVSALRYYDQVNLLRPAGRRGSVRTYGREELHRLALIHLLHRDGMMSLDATAATLAERPTTRDVIENSRDEVRRRIQRLREAERLLDHLLTCPRDNPVRDCPHLRTQLDHVVDTALAGSAGR